ncbi:two-component system, NtrC family, sensor kinase [Pseudoalteromonas ulvae UL12]|uniref:sensor histidine kinase n=1 Tax=Pseudoalteromonas ulvae TaxID=107327 RepID=UPI00186B95F3|nr:ATP-binding protein [Pseudoalteromonas ulvae]MBE0364530.1 two-component system, NtrC family, sensor kinase [Pseudoalteromonas ulvae UL12]
MSQTEQQDSALLALKAELETEKSEREHCEAQLKATKQALIDTQSELEFAGSSTESRQNQLEFLTYLATVTFSQEKLEGIIQSFLLRCANFFMSTSAYIHGGEAKSTKVPLLSDKASAGSLAENLSDIDLTQVIASIQEAENETVLMSGEQFFLKSHPLVKTYQYVVVLPLFSIKSHYHLLAIFFKDDHMLDSSKLQTLESGRNLVKIAIARKLAQIKLDKKYNELNVAYHSLEQAQRQLTQAEKMASIGQLAAGVAHEINNPIGFVMSNINSLQEYVSDLKEYFQQSNEGKLEEEDKTEVAFLLNDSGEIIDSCKSGLTRVCTIVKDLKTFSHSGQEQFIEFSVNECIESALNILASEFKYEAYEIKKQFSDVIDEVTGTKNQLEQVILNILVNAKQAMPDGGEISISTYMDDDFICISIQDFGCGMDEATQQKLFDPFFTTKPVGIGTGLGLSISFGIIEAHHGTIEVSSKVGEGSCFTIKLPSPSKQKKSNTESVA